LAPLEPDFVTVTYGAGGTTRAHTLGSLERIVHETGLHAAGHLTCVGATREDVNDVVRSYQKAGVRHIVALRGDPQGGVGERYVPHPDGYATTADLIRGIRTIGDFEITVSAYPEKHPESPSFDADIDVLKAKIDAGATRAITQFFFDNELYFRYRDRAAARGVTIPILPGILPVQNFHQTANFAAKTGATIPDWLAKRFEGLDNDPATRRLIAASVAAEQVFDLLDHGISDFHFYTMNRAELTFAICHLLGIRPKIARRAA
jgi:methylenetetrahydrofolate reductase (NADPH)